MKSVSLVFVILVFCPGLLFADYEVSGAGSDEVNGTYEYFDDNDGCASCGMECREREFGNLLHSNGNGKILGPREVFASEVKR